MATTVKAATEVCFKKRKKKKKASATGNINRVVAPLREKSRVGSDEKGEGEEGELGLYILKGGGAPEGLNLNDVTNIFAGRTVT